MTFCKLVVCFCFLFAVTLHSKPIISLQSERNDFPVISTKRSAWRDLRRALDYAQGDKGNYFFFRLGFMGNQPFSTRFF